MTLIERLQHHYYHTGTTDTDELVKEAIEHIRELEAALKQVAMNCNAETGCKGYELYYKLCPASETPGHPPATPPPGGWPKAFIPVTDNNDISITPQAETKVDQPTKGE
jgi:hypothetical protein